MSPARDLDVFVGKLLADSPKSGVREGLVPLRARAESARDTAWSDGDHLRCQRRFRRCSPMMWRRLASSQLPLSRMTSACRARPNACWTARCRRVKKRGRGAKIREEGDLHRLRIALKKLRYTAEFFAPLYSRKNVGPLSAKSCAACRIIWATSTTSPMCAVWWDSLMREKGKKEDDSAMRYAAGAMVGWYGAQVPGAIKQALKRYKKFKRVRPFWR